VTGDWNEDGIDTPGLVRDNQWLLRNSNTSGRADISFTYGDQGELGFPVVGDWNGNGSDSPGLVRDGFWLLRNSNTTGAANLAFGYGNPFPQHWPTPGDWDGNATDTPGVVDLNQDPILWCLRNSNTGGFADFCIGYF